MSKLEELIQQLCPDGVEYRQLGEIATYATGRIDAQSVNADTYVGVDNLLPDKRGKTTSDYVPVSGKLVEFLEGDILIGNIRPYLKKIWRATCSGGTNGDVLTIRPNSQDEICSEFLYCILSSDVFFLYDMQNSKGAKMPRGDKAAVLRYRLPVPPLEVQQEIVRILDQFTELTAELTTQLTAEFATRKKQYEYYQQKVFAFDDNNIGWATLSQIADIGTGSSNTNEESEDGIYPFFVRSQEVRRKNTFEYDEMAIITSGDGVGVGKIFHYVEGKYALHQRAYRIHITDERVLPKFCFYYMKSSFLAYIEKASFHSSVTSIRRPMLNNFPVPIPSLTAQHRIASILDHFDNLCNDLTRSLPVEIEARRKQYEYYRDKLLTFKKKASDSFRGE